VDHVPDLLRRDRPLVAGKQDPLLDFRAVVSFPGIVLFNDHKRQRFQLFIGGKPFPALLALSPPPDRAVVIRRAGIDHLRILRAAVWTLHFHPLLVFSSSLTKTISSPIRQIFPKGITYSFSLPRNPQIQPGPGTTIAFICPVQGSNSRSPTNPSRLQSQ